ncbi:MAG TPA: PilZ domain-containing protein [Rhizomicrobium sp.]|nr:PilZ domain-containing protein [Rhizomicrobium sp.]
MRSRFQINPGASFGTSKGSAYGSIRTKVFGTPLQHRGLSVRSVLPNDKAAKWAQPWQPSPNTSLPSKPAVSEHYVSKPVRHRQPIEYLGHLIANEQQPDGSWVASFVRMGGGADSAQLSAAYPASYMAFSDARRQIDAASSGPDGNRKFARVPVALEGAIFATAITQECQILDLSQGGARLRLRKPIAHEEKLNLYIRGFGRFHGQVVRSSESEMSVRFTVDNEAISRLLSGLANYVRGLDLAQTTERKEVRVTTSIETVCWTADGVAAIPCEIIDTSRRSMSLRISERPRVGSRVTVGDTKVRVIRHHSQGIAVQCLPPPGPKSGRFIFKEA